MKEDSDIAELYQETLYNTRVEKEADQKRIADIHDRFDELKDPDIKRNKDHSELFDLKEQVPCTEDDVATTEFSDEEANLFYRRYKIAHYEAK